MRISRQKNNLEGKSSFTVKGKKIIISNTRISQHKTTLEGKSSFTVIVKTLSFQIREFPCRRSTSKVKVVLQKWEICLKIQDAYLTAKNTLEGKSSFTVKIYIYIYFSYIWSSRRVFHGRKTIWKVKVALQ